ncbi:AAA family ATPase [Blautia schinkii]|nr:AAA family ATPase [Blautia schinkii]
MYEAFFEMGHTPFVRDVPPSQLYESSAMADTLGRLAYTADRQLFAVVTADAGCGRSTLIRRFVSSLPKEGYLLLYLSDSKLTPRWFYKGMLDQLGLESRFLLNYRFDSMSPMALVLAGQSELWDKLRLQRYAAVRQRIDISCVLPHFDRAETENYIGSHLAYAGGKQEIFTDKALDDIYKESAGIARQVNRICEKSLMYASQQGKRLIDEHLVRYVIEHEMLGGGEPCP